MLSPIKIVVLACCLPLSACVTLRPAEPAWGQVNADYNRLYPTCGGAAAGLQSRRMGRRHVRFTWCLLCNSSDLGIPIDLDYEWIDGRWQQVQGTR